MKLQLPIVTCLMASTANYVNSSSNSCFKTLTQTTPSPLSPAIDKAMASTIETDHLENVLTQLNYATTNADTLEKKIDELNSTVSEIQTDLKNLGSKAAAWEMFTFLNTFTIIFSLLGISAKLSKLATQASPSVLPTHHAMR